MSGSKNGALQLHERIWAGSIPLRITLSPLDCRDYDNSMPYLVQAPRLSYLPFLLPRLHSFFQASLINPDVLSHAGWFSFQGAPLKWQHPVGLLFDLLSGAEPASLEEQTSKTQFANQSLIANGAGSILPWQLVLHYSEWPIEHLIPLDDRGKALHDAFMNSVKEADFLRNGTAKVIKSLSFEDSNKIWRSVQDNDFRSFLAVNVKLLNPSDSTPLRNVPVKIYLPVNTPTEASGAEQPRAMVKLVQGPVSPLISGKELQTVGTALRSLVPSVFPSKLSYIHAQAVLHGAVVPIAAPVQELMRTAAYADGFLHIAVRMIG